MPDVIVVGDGPGGLSAALFLARNGQEAVVYGDDKTAMHSPSSTTTWACPAFPDRSSRHAPSSRSPLPVPPSCGTGWRL